LCNPLDPARLGGDVGTMDRILYRFHSAITLTGGGPFDLSLFNRAVALAPTVIAADGGADKVAAFGYPVTAVIGDFDSIDIERNWLNSGVGLHRIAEQETTDFEKCLYSVEAPLFLGLGFLSGLTDHALAALSALLAYENKRILLVGEQDVTFLWAEGIDLILAKGTRISLFPLVEVTGTRSEGLAWNVAGLRMKPGGRIGTSNQATGGKLRPGFDRSGVLVTLPLTCLEAVAAALV
jgi:thiamine pyrophosphokinase